MREPGVGEPRTEIQGRCDERFADPEAGFSFGYTMNRMGLGVLPYERGQSLVDAVYRCLGYGSNESGCWTR